MYGTCVLYRPASWGGSISGRFLVWVGAVRQQQVYNIKMVSLCSNKHYTYPVVRPCLLLVGAVRQCSTPSQPQCDYPVLLKLVP